MQRPLVFTLDELRQHEPMHQFITLACISNPTGGDLIGTTRWTGVSLKRLLPELILNDAATHLRITSADGFSESLAIETIRNDERIMLAYAWDGVPLPAEHGFPLRIYIPDLYGMKQPKWIVAIDADRSLGAGLLGGSRLGPRRSRGDRVGYRCGVRRGRPPSSAASPMPAAAACRRSRSAWTKASGSTAELRDPLSKTTWVLWRAKIAVPQGDHVFTVRAFDGAGRPQMAGFHTRSS